MFGLLLKKELKVFFSSKANLAVMLLLPILLLIIFGSALGSYIQMDYGTFDDGVVLYYQDGTGNENTSRFWEIAERITDSTGVTFIETDDYNSAKAQVEASEAYGVITINAEGFSYFRSTFNEPEGAAMVRGLFVQLADASNDSVNSDIEQVIIPAAPVDAKAYYTFASLAFSIMFMGLLVGFSVQNEKSLDTIERIQLSRAGVGRMFVAKVLTGVLCGVGQITIVLLFSSLFYGVAWGQNVVLIIFLYLFLALYSAMFGGVVGLFCHNKSLCQNIVLMVSMLSGYLGGSITPITLLESTPFMSAIVNVSPLYWINRAVTNLRNNILDESILYAVLVLIFLISVMVVASIIATRKTSPKDITRKEAVAA